MVIPTSLAEMIKRETPKEYLVLSCGHLPSPQDKDGVYMIDGDPVCLSCLNKKLNQDMTNIPSLMK